MKICIVDERYPPRSEGGASNYAKRSADALSARGHDVVVITAKPYEGFHSLRPSVRMDGEVKIIEFVPINIYDTFDAERIPIFLKPLFHVVNLWNPIQYRVFKRLVKAERPDIVHVHTMDNLSLCLFDAVRNLGIPSVVTLHGFNLLCPRVSMIRSSGKTCENPPVFCGMLRRLRSAVIGNKPTAVIAPSRFFLDYFEKIGFFEGCEKMHLPLFVDEAEAEHWSENNGKKNGFDILYAGRLGYHKGVHVLVEAFRNLPFPDAHLHIFGKGDHEQALRELSKMDQRIQFYGWVSRESMLGRGVSFDITVVPSLCYENSPYVIYESFCSGIPVVGSRIGGIPELVKDGYNGSLFSPGDADELQRVLTNLIERKDSLSQLKANAKESANSYSMKEHVTRLLEIYGKAIQIRSEQQAR